MDYSLLVCIEKIGKGGFSINYEKKPNEKHIFSNEKTLYHIAIIDYLQEWNLNKKGERLLKTMVM